MRRRPSSSPHTDVVFPTRRMAALRSGRAHARSAESAEIPRIPSGPARIGWHSFDRPGRAPRTGTAGHPRAVSRRMRASLPPSPPPLPPLKTEKIREESDRLSVGRSACRCEHSVIASLPLPCRPPVCNSLSRVFSRSLPLPLW